MTDEQKYTGLRKVAESGIRLLGRTRGVMSEVREVATDVGSLVDGVIEFRR